MAFHPLLMSAFRRTAGFARDEMVLTTLVVGSLSTFGIVVGMPWDALTAGSRRAVPPD